MEPFYFGIIKGVQPLIRASRASKVAGAFLVLFWHAKENIFGGNVFYKSRISLLHATTLCTGILSKKVCNFIIPFKLHKKVPVPFTKNRPLRVILLSNHSA